MDKKSFVMGMNMGGGSAKPQGIQVGVVTNGSTFPTARPDGSALQNEDYVKTDPSSTFPFDIGDITFTNSKDKAYYMSGSWFLEAGILQNTKETPLAEPTEESYDEDELLSNQYQVNKTVMDNLRNNIIESEDLDSIETDKIVKRIYHQTEDTEVRDKGLYWYNADSEEEDKWEKVGSADVMPYEYLLPVGDIDNSYMAEVSYTDLDYTFADEYYQNNITNFGACSTIVKDGKLIRNYDWKYSNSCGFVVRTPKINNRHAVLGVVGQVDGLTKDFVKSRKYSDMYKIVPFALTDGQNDMGLKASILVVPNDKGDTTGTLASGKRVNALMFIRYILDHYASVEEVKRATQSEISIFVPQSLRDMGYEVHFVIADNKENYVLEFVNNACKWTETDKATNFFIDGTTFKSDGTVAVIGDSDIADYGLTYHAEGLERYNILVNHSGTDEQLVEALKYSQLYTLDTNKWYSELCSGDLKITSSIADFETAMTTARQQYAERSRDTALTDHTVHSVIYGKDGVKLFTQENYTVSYEFNIERDIISSDRVELVDGAVESFSGEAETQAEVNKEIIDELKFLELKPDVVDIVQCYDRGTDATKTDIVHYDLDTILVNDIVKVLIDETHDDKVSYFKVIESGTPAVKSFSYIGSDKPVEVDDLTIDKDTSGKIQMKDKGHDFTKVKDTAIGDGLEKSADGTKIQHSNLITAETTGKGSTSKSLTAKWDAQGHITEVEENDIDFDSVELTTATGTLTSAQKAILEKSKGSYILYDGNILRKDSELTTTLIGTWRFNDELILPENVIDVACEFNCAGTLYDEGMYITQTEMYWYSSHISEISNKQITAYALEDPGIPRWFSEDYKTIELLTVPTSEDFSRWLKNNATKQSSNEEMVVRYSSDKYTLTYDSTGAYTITPKESSGVDWGGIGGNIEEQTDLSNKLDELVPKETTIAGIDLEDDITSTELGEAIIDDGTLIVEDGKIGVRELGLDAKHLRNTTMGTGLSKSTDGTRINHTNSIFANANNSLKSFTYDTEGHITSGTNKRLAGGLADVGNVIGHENAVTPQSTSKIYKTSIDAYGHHTGTQTGYDVQTSVRASGTAVDTSLTTEKAVRDQIELLVPKTRTIAGIDLGDNITAYEIENAIVDKDTIKIVGDKISVGEKSLYGTHINDGVIGTGLSKSSDGKVINHSNSITAQTTAKLGTVKFDAQGHITGFTEKAVVNNLTSTATDQPLSANQGKVLNTNKIDTAGTGLTKSGTTLGHSNSITAGTVGSATSVPAITYDAEGHITAISGKTIYPPTTAGTANQYWRSDGSGAGTWTTPASTFTSGTATALATAGGVYNALLGKQNKPTITPISITSNDSTLTINNNRSHKISYDSHEEYFYSFEIETSKAISASSSYITWGSTKIAFGDVPHTSHAAFACSGSGGANPVASVDVWGSPSWNNFRLYAPNGLQAGQSIIVYGHFVNVL